jgi:CRP-like cAMP-binding protein
MIGPEYFLHTSNLMRVVSFSAKDVMWLRIFAIIASLLGLPYFYLQAEVLWEPLVWATVFMTLNLYHVWRLWLERRPVQLSPEETILYDLTFFPLNPRMFLEVARLGRWTDFEAGEVLIRPGEPIAEVSVPLTESIEARVGERSLGRFASGAIIGANALFTNRVQLLGAVAGENCRVLRLPVAALKERAKRDDQLARTLDRIARDDLARKLEHLVNIAAAMPVNALGRSTRGTSRVDQRLS